MGEEKVFDSCLDLMRRLPPQKVEKNLADLIEISPPGLMEDLLATIDQPLKLAVCKETNRQYLLCDYNRDGDSYRSPWSNKYDPPMADGITPTDKLRQMEIELNNAFDQYRYLYFEGGVSSVYLWDLSDNSGGFAGVVLIKKAGEGSDMTKGSWDSVHVFEANTSKKVSPKQSYKFSVTSTIMLWLQTNKNCKSINIGGNLTRQAQETGIVSKDCTLIEHLGKIIEDMENRMRQTMNDIYFGKTKDIIGSLRSTVPLKEAQQWGKIADELGSKNKK